MPRLQNPFTHEREYARRARYLLLTKLARRTKKKSGRVFLRRSKVVDTTDEAQRQSVFDEERSYSYITSLRQDQYVARLAFGIPRHDMGEGRGIQIYMQYHTSKPARAGLLYYSSSRYLRLTNYEDGLLIGFEQYTQQYLNVLHSPQHINHVFMVYTSTRCTACAE